MNLGTAFHITNQSLSVCLQPFLSVLAADRPIQCKFCILIPNVLSIFICGRWAIRKKGCVGKGAVNSALHFGGNELLSTKKSSPAHLEGGAEPAGVKLKQKKC